MWISVVGCTVYKSPLKNVIIFWQPIKSNLMWPKNRFFDNECFFIIIIINDLQVRRHIHASMNWSYLYNSYFYKTPFKVHPTGLPLTHHFYFLLCSFSFLLLALSCHSNSQKINRRNFRFSFFLFVVNQKYWKRTYSLVKLHYSQFTFLETCIYKKQKKSIKDQRNFCSSTSFKVFANFF